MLTQLRNANFRDCVCMTDHAVKGLAERCRQIDTLSLRGCHKVTDASLRAMVAKNGERLFHQTALCDTLKVLDLSYCAGMTAAGLGNVLLPQCASLEELHLSGITSLDDAFVGVLCKCCPALQVKLPHPHE